MTNQEILTKAIERAMANEWSPDNYGTGIDKRFVLNHEMIIFDQNFAKALWGDDPTGWKCEHCGLVSSFIPKWKVHLQQMVLADDPIQYLGEHLNEENN